MNKGIRKVFMRISILVLVFLLNVWGSGALLSNGEVAYSEPLIEMRGVWVATVSNIDIAKQAGADEVARAKWKADFITILDKMDINNMNAIFMQIRPVNDAFYPSAYNPWSNYLVSYGKDPGWDPLTWMIEETHKRGYEFHAWLNPYRASVGNFDLASHTEAEINQYKRDYANTQKTLCGSNTYDNPLFEENQDEFNRKIVLGAEGKLILNPAHPATITHVANTIEEIITNFEVDGIHFDDYFYPNAKTYFGYPIEPWIDDMDFAEYVRNGGKLNRYDWRRSNVDKMVKTVSDLVSEFNETTTRARKVAFGISPAPIWAPAPENCSVGVEGGVLDVPCYSYSTYHNLYADTKKWVEQEWVDYIIPQAYFPLSGLYKPIVNWWAKVVEKTNVKLYIGSAIYRLEEWKNEKGVYEQMLYIGKNENLVGKVHGYVFYSYSKMIRTEPDFSIGMSWIRTLWKREAITPVYNEVNLKPPTHATLSIYQVGSENRIQFNEVENAKGYVLFKFKSEEEIHFSRDKIVQVFLQTNTSTPHVIDLLANDEDKYVLRTLDLNNQFLEEYSVAQPEVTIPNTAPVISNVDFTNGKSVLIGNDVANIRAKIVDAENNPIEATLYLATDGENFNRSFPMVLIEDDIYGYDWTVYLVNLPNARMKIVATDGALTSEYLSSYFEIKATDQEDPEPEKPGLNCRTKSNSFFLNFIMLLGSVLLIKRRGK